MSARPRLLVVGASGQVGHELVGALASLGDLATAGRRGTETFAASLDEPRSLSDAVEVWRPRVVVNAAAYTAVDRAESEPDVALRQNAEAPEALAEACARVGAVLVHYGTDYVFDGRSDRPWREDDEPRPLSVYGRSKREGELRIAASGAAHLVLRTSWVYARRGTNFLRTMERLLRERPEVRVVDDQRGAPTWARALAEATRDVLVCLHPLGGPLDPRAVSGVYHATCRGETTWYGFARAIHAWCDASASLVPIPTSGYPTPARRPAYSVLDGARLERTFGVRLSTWEEAFSRCVAEPA